MNAYNGHTMVQGRNHVLEVGVQFIGLVIVQNEIRMVYAVSCTAVCCVTVIITLFIKKVGVVHPNFGGSGPPRPPQLLRPCSGQQKLNLRRSQV